MPSVTATETNTESQYVYIPRVINLQPGGRTIVLKYFHNKKKRGYFVSTGIDTNSG